MRSSTELREPFLDHRLFELSLRQPQQRKIHEGRQKWLLREMAQKLMPGGVAEAPKRPLQTPQREWLKRDLKEWANECIKDALAAYGDTWLNREAVNRIWQEYCEQDSDNSFYIWQWINLALWKNNSLNETPLHLNSLHVPPTRDLE
jgi:asparagine synthase (glutamine-hydrolysing)